MSDLACGSSNPYQSTQSSNVSVPSPENEVCVCSEEINSVINITTPPKVEDKFTNQTTFNQGKSESQYPIFEAENLTCEMPVEKQVCEMPARENISNDNINNTGPRPGSYEKITLNKAIGLQEGVNMYMPKNPVKNGKVDLIIQFRGETPKGFSEGGVNAVIICAETQGLSGAMMEKFGKKDFVPKIIDKAMFKVKQQYGQDVKEGRLALGSFSAGYAPLQIALSNPQIKEKADAVIVLDGIHYGKYGHPDPSGHKPFVDFAKEAVSGNKLMVITHSSIQTNNASQNYSSSTNAADYIIQQVGGKRTQVNDQTGLNENIYPNRYKDFVTPASRADLNDFHVEGYNGGQAKNHVEQIDNVGNIWNKYLAPRWD